MAANKKNKYNIMKVDEFDLDKIKYASMKTLDSGAKMAYINYDTDNNPIRFQTSDCELPFDASYFPDQSKNCGKFSVKISLKNDPKFSEKIKEFDDKLKEDAMQYSKEWLKNQMWFWKILEKVH